LAIWEALGGNGMLDGSLVGRLAGLVHRRTALHGNGSLRRILRERLPAQTFAELVVPFECVAASVERAREHWFDSGDLAWIHRSGGALGWVVNAKCPVVVGE
jgi:NTE family protein